MAKISKADRYAFFIPYCESIIKLKPIAEHRFHPVRKWRFDFALPDKMIAIEVEGGFFSKNKSGHSSGVGAREDMEKYNAAAELGWIVLRYMPEHLDRAQTFEQIKRVYQMRSAQIK